MITTRACLAVMAGALLLGTAFPAHSKALECREWIDRQYKGKVTITLNEASVTVSADDELRRLMNYAYSIVYSKDNRAVLIGMQKSKDDEWWSPIVIVSLDFGRAKIAVKTDIGGELEWDNILSDVQWACRRLD